MTRNLPWALFAIAIAACVAVDARRREAEARVADLAREVARRDACDDLLEACLGTLAVARKALDQADVRTARANLQAAEASERASIRCARGRGR